MGDLASNQVLLGQTLLNTPAAPVLVGNNGLFSGVVRNSAGRHTFTLARNIEPTDTFKVSIISAAAAGSAIAFRLPAPNQLGVIATNGNDLPTDLVYTLSVTRTLRG